MLTVMFLGAFVFLTLEKANNENLTFWNSVYWAMVTMTTVGYGDITPVTAWSKVASGAVIFSGMILISLFTATIASIMTARRIKEGRGLESVTLEGHIVICGWNHHADEVIGGLIKLEAAKSADLLIINDLPEEEVNEILFRYDDRGLSYVRGDFVQESVLKRANISGARAAIVLAQTQEGDLRVNTDERTIFATLAIKTIKPEVKVCAEILDSENAQHLRRADVDDIIIRGEYSGFLLASAAVSTGITEAVRELLTYDPGNEIWRADIPKEYVGKTFKDLASYYRERFKAILIGIIAEEQGIPLEDMISDDTSQIDQFIKREFLLAGRDISAETKKKAETIVNPDDDYEILEDDKAIVIARDRITIK